MLDQGTGDTAVFLLHGVGGGKQAWARNLPALAAAGYRAVAWDMPGYGASETVDPYDTAQLARALTALIDHVAARHTVVLGHSMGGMVAQEAQARYPERLQGLILTGTSAAFGRPDGDWQRRFLHSRFAPLDAGKDMAALAHDLVPGMMAPDADACARADACRMMAAVPQATYRAALRAIVAFNRLDDLARIGVPTLLLAGEHDRNAPPAGMRRMAERVRHGQYLCLPGVGHLANMEQPQAFNAAVLAFLRTHFPV